MPVEIMNPSTPSRAMTGEQQISDIIEAVPIKDPMGPNWFADCEESAENEGAPKSA